MSCAIFLIAGTFDSFFSYNAVVLSVSSINKSLFVSFDDLVVSFFIV
jgi:hypothetical protein